jgi:hypothetical protein
MTMKKDVCLSALGNLELDMKLADIHSQFLMKFNNERLAPALSDVTQTLHEAVPELWISISALHRYLSHKCKLTLKSLKSCLLQR